MLLKWTSREKYLLVITIVLSAALISLLISRFFAQEPGEELTFTPLPAQEEDEQIPHGGTGELSSLPLEESGSVVIDIKGAVAQPGVYQLASGERVIDAIETAGGLLEEGSTLPLNLAQPLTDGMVIYVPSWTEVEDGASLPLPADVGWGNAEGKISLNRGTAEELQRLPGIGPAKAEAIIMYREEHGPFRSVDDLINVRGIGPKTLEQLREHVEP